VRPSHAIALTLLGGSGIAGLAVMAQRFRESPDLALLAVDPSTIALAASVGAVLLLFGFFLGVAYESSRHSRSHEARTISRVKEALSRERNERRALAGERLAARERIVALEEEVAALGHELDAAREGGERDGSREEADELRGELEGLTSRFDKLRWELSNRRERMVDLQAELSVAQTEAELARAEAERLRPVSPPPDVVVGRSVREALEGIASLDGVHVALVADDQGLVVDAVGEELPPDTLAAVSRLAAEISPRVGDLLPVGDISTVALGNVDGWVLEVRYFDLLGARCALVIARDETASYPEAAARAVEVVAARLAD